MKHIKPIAKEIAQNKQQEQKKLIHMIGQRLKEAREINNFSQMQAAKMLGYATSSKLSKIENASDTHSIPLITLLHAAQLYEVSLDFLFGRTRDFDMGERATCEREVSAWLLKHWEAAREQDLAILRQLHLQIHTLDQHLKSLDQIVQNIDQAFNRFCELNPKFDQARAGNRLLTSIEAAKCEINSAKLKMKWIFSGGQNQNEKIKGLFQWQD